MAHKNTQALADLLDDLTPEQLTDLIFNMWVGGKVTRGDIKGFRKDIGKPAIEILKDSYFFGDKY
jgi:hypothetical protein